MSTGRLGMRNAAAALVAFLFAALGTSIDTEGILGPAELVPGVLLSLVASGALFTAPRWPRAATAVAICCETAACALGYLPTPLLLAPLIGCLYWLAVVGSVRAVAWWTGSAVAAVILGSLIDTPTGGSLVLRTVGVALWLLPAVFAGRTTQTHRSYLDVVQARAEDAERSRDDEIRHRVGEERLRIARELHDVVAHHLTVAHAQAGTAEHLLDKRPQQARELLAGLSASTSAALQELKATVAVLRTSDDDPPADTVPAPGLDQLDELIEPCRAAGIEVTVHREGPLECLPRLVDVTAYRVVQEALTNVTKHADRPAVTITVRRTGDTFSVHVENTGVRPGPVGSGYGLIGMHERALAVGGTVHAGPAGEGRYAVTFTAPLTPWEGPR
ncbi:histidine kinase [Modestobacter sp. VKM Ac-2979]|uniref:sensor histidine kinase n=1 Tax=unclassified Modestobacter TaxID=2643866 RepID=UPI0022AB685A|nr:MULTISPECIES: histidine kinase [unclassified Modestobacter]MCZ2811948.1 histidine kinase [Modestobacter sp. VKM Ac-2979]MCZ2843671.1 histidine kinase [Modestobacter sp. VKM Ac-2980]